MTVQTNNNSISYVGNGSTAHFDYDYLILDASHLKVYFGDVLQTSGYVVSGVSSQTGGTVAFAVAPPNGTNITLIRDVPFLQLTDYQPYDAFPAESHERALDLLTMMAQQLKDELGRTMQYPVGGDKWDARGNEIINVGTGGSGTSATNVDQVKYLIASEVGDDPSASASARSREALRRSYAEAGFNLVTGSFELGGTVTTATDVLLYEADGKAYSWDGVLPKVVMAGSSPTPIATGSWVLVGDASLRGGLAATTGGTLVKLANGKSVEQDSQQSGIVRGNDGVKYAISGCAVRRDTTLSPNWQLVSDSAHIPINTTGVTGGVDVNIQYGVGGNDPKIGTCVAGPDERFAADGVLVGASVAATNANISLGAPCSFFVNFDNANTITFDTKFFDASRFGVSVAASGLITLTHPQRRLMQMPMCQHTSGGSSFETLTPHFINTSSEGVTSFYLVGEAEGLISYNGTSWGISTSSWTSGEMAFAWDAANGVLTVTHPSVMGSSGCSISAWDNGGDLTVMLSAVTATGFKVRFRKLDGSAPALSSALGVYFSRGNSAIRKVPSGRVNVYLGHVQVNCNHVNYPNGNFWFISSMQV